MVIIITTTIIFQRSKTLSCPWWDNGELVVRAFVFGTSSSSSSSMIITRMRRKIFHHHQKLSLFSFFSLWKKFLKSAGPDPKKKIKTKFAEPLRIDQKTNEWIYLEWRYLLLLNEWSTTIMKKKRAKSNYMIIIRMMAKKDDDENGLI